VLIELGEDALEDPDLRLDAKNSFEFRTDGFAFKFERTDEYV